MNQSSGQNLEDIKVPVRIKIALLWAALIFLYIYNDYFSLYLPGTIEDMSAGIIGPLGKADKWIFLAVSMVLAIPSLMVFLSVVLPSSICRWSNIILGVFYTFIQALTFPNSALFYQVVVVMEICVTLWIIWYAARWPRVTD